MLSDTHYSEIRVSTTAPDTLPYNMFTSIDVNFSRVRSIFFFSQFQTEFEFITATRFVFSAISRIPCKRRLSQIKSLFLFLYLLCPWQDRGLLFRRTPPFAPLYFLIFYTHDGPPPLLSPPCPPSPSSVAHSFSPSHTFMQKRRTASYRVRWASHVEQDRTRDDAPAGRSLAHDGTNETVSTFGLAGCPVLSATYPPRAHCGFSPISSGGGG